MMGALRSKLHRWTGALGLRLHLRASDLSQGTPLPGNLFLAPPEPPPLQFASRQIEDYILLADYRPVLDEIVHPVGRADISPLELPPMPTGRVLTAHLLGSFCLSIDDLPIEKLPNGRSGSLLKYLLYHHQRRIAREALMEAFWPGADPDVSRNRLNVTMSNIRHTLRQASDVEVILFEDSRYFIDAGLQIWLDVEELETSLERARQAAANGKTAAAVQYHETAASLYQGDFLEDDLYEEWTVPIRERLRLAYLDTLFHLSRYYFETRQYTACVGMCQTILERDNCREDVHCLLMRCYARQNQFYLALRQYQVCVGALRAELDMAPAAATMALHEKLRRRELTDPLARSY
jgi:DNA-binding SARP family transcriptional activator